MTGVAIAVGGGLGAVARYVVSVSVAARYRGIFPLGTFVVNVTGSAGLGVLAGAIVSGRVPAGLTPWLVIGFFGGYTTFSTFAYENLRLLQDGAWRPVIWNTVGSAGAAFASAAVGYALML